MNSTAKKVYGDQASLDCHLAQVLVKRYLGGDELPPEVVADLERHLKVCADCKAVALGKTKPLIERPKGPTAEWISILTQPKHIGLAVALVVVLVGMGSAMRNPAGLLGRKVKMTPAQELAAKTAAAEEETEEESKEPSAETAKEDEHAKVDEHAKGDDHAEPTTAHDEPKATTKPAATEAHEDHSSASKTPHVEVEKTKPKPEKRFNEGTPTVSKVRAVEIVEDGGKKKSKAKKEEAKPAETPKTEPAKSESESTTSHQKVASEPHDPLADVTIYDSNGKPIK